MQPQLYNEMIAVVAFMLLEQTAKNDIQVNGLNRLASVRIKHKFTSAAIALNRKNMEMLSLALPF